MNKGKNKASAVSKYKDIAAVILAGGKASRMNNTDKALVKLGGRELISYVIERAASEVDKIVLSVNRNLQNYQTFNLPLIEDRCQQYAGPLLGIHSAMNWITSNAAGDGFSEIKYLACFPTDVPIFPSNIIGKLHDAIQLNDSSLAMVQTGNQLQPLFSLWRVDTYAKIDAAIKSGIYGPKFFAQQLDYVVINFALERQKDFFNINTPDDLKKAESFMRTGL